MSASRPTNMRRSAARSIAFLCATAAAGGCAATTAQDALDDPTAVPAAPPADERDIVDWFAARGFDLLDVASVRLGAGPGLLAHARATRWVALGSGSMGPVTAWQQTFTMPLYKLGWLRREGGTWIERRAEAGISTFYYLEAEAEPLAGNIETFGMDARGPFDVGAELHLALLGLAAEVRPDEVLDFALGLVGVDLMDDDG